MKSRRPTPPRKKVDVIGVCFNHSSNYAPEATTSKKEVNGVSAGSDGTSSAKKSRFLDPFRKAREKANPFSHLICSLAGVR